MTNLADRLGDVSDSYLEVDDIGNSTTLGLDELYSSLDDNPDPSPSPVRYSHSGGIRVVKSFNDPSQGEPFLFTSPFPGVPLFVSQSFFFSDRRNISLKSPFRWHSS